MELELLASLASRLVEAGFLAEANDAFFAPCVVQQQEAYHALRASASHQPGDYFQLWSIQHCPQGQLSATFLGHGCPDSYNIHQIPLGSVSPEYLSQVTGARTIQLGRI